MMLGMIAGCTKEYVQQSTQHATVQHRTAGHGTTRHYTELRCLSQRYGTLLSLDELMSQAELSWDLVQLF